MAQVHAGLGLEDLGREERHRAQPGGGVVECAGFRLRQLHEIRERPHRQRRMDHDDVRRRIDLRHRGEIAK
jgi:hypothetical protein